MPNPLLFLNFWWKCCLWSWKSLPGRRGRETAIIIFTLGIYCWTFFLVVTVEQLVFWVLNLYWKGLRYFDLYKVHGGSGGAPEDWLPVLLSWAPSCFLCSAWSQHWFLRVVMVVRHINFFSVILGFSTVEGLFSFVIFSRGIKYV